MEEETIRNLQEALKVSPDNLPLRLMLAEAFLQAKRTEQAEQEFKIVLERDPMNLQGRTGLAKTCYELKKYSTTIVIIEELLEASPGNSALLLLLSKSLLKNNEAGKALQH